MKSQQQIEGGGKCTRFVLVSSQKQSFAGGRVTSIAKNEVFGLQIMILFILVPFAKESFIESHPSIFSTSLGVIFNASPILVCFSLFIHWWSWHHVLPQCELRRFQQRTWLTKSVITYCVTINLLLFLDFIQQAQKIIFFLIHDKHAVLCAGRLNSPCGGKIKGQFQCLPRH